MINAKDELLVHIVDRTILCAVFEDNPHYVTARLALPVGYSPEVYQAFLNALDREYDNGYGTQMLYGTIWYTDGTWSTRGEYDGSEWWDHHSRPDVPECCKATGIEDTGVNLNFAG